jgi:signal transduction histidine kinase
MRSRRLLFAGVVTASILFGAWLFLGRWHPGITGLAHSVPTRAPRSAAATVKGSPDLTDAVLSKLLYIIRVLSADKETLVYAALAVLGILMMVLAIANSSPAEKNKTDAMLELLRAEKEKAENLAKLKSEFLNQVSHELRTPLSVIIGYLECLTDGLYGKIDGKHQEILEVVAKQSGHLKNMIDQILIFSRLEANKATLRIQEFDPGKALAELRDTFNFLCVQKGIELRWELSPATPTMKSDPDRFKEIASNLLQNAVKYTDRGSITVTLRMLVPTDSIVLEVADSGVGIPSTAVKTIFEPFVQVNKTSTTNSRGGIGLGLSILKKHVEHLKGTISIDSEVGKGSTFRVSLPRIYRDKESRYRKLLRLLKVTGNGEQLTVIRTKGTAQLQAAANRVRRESTVT